MLVAVTLKEPPRNTRLFGADPGEHDLRKQSLAQAMGISLSGMPQPAHQGGVYITDTDTSGGKQPLQPANPSPEPADTFGGQQTVCGKNTVAEESYTTADRKDGTFLGVQFQTQRTQKLCDPGFATV